MNDYQSGIDGMSRMLEEALSKLSGFTRSQYSDTFQSYYQAYVSAFDSIEKLYGSVVEKDTMLANMSRALVDTAAARMESVKKRDRERVQIDLNLSMAVFVLPAILQYKGESSRPLCDRVVSDWKETFPKSQLTPAEFEYIEKGFHKKFCYITTAVCDTLGKGDDCYELNLLRRYRDGYMRSQPDGSEKIRAYYDVAPSIVKHIRERSDSAEVFRKIYSDFIAPCIRDIENGDNESCLARYTEMVFLLKERYFYEVSV